MLIHVWWYYMFHGNTFYIELHVPWYYMLNGTTCYMAHQVIIYANANKICGINVIPSVE